eukprot:7814377-Alexandrium_andersonii.AAC.1
MHPRWDEARRERVRSVLLSMRPDANPSRVQRWLKGEADIPKATLRLNIALKHYVDECSLEVDGDVHAGPAIDAPYTL